MLLFEDLALVPIVFALGAMAPQRAEQASGRCSTRWRSAALTAVGDAVPRPLLLPQLFAQAARTKSPELFLSACLLVVIVASLVDLGGRLFAGRSAR